MRTDLNTTIHEKYGKEDGTSKAIDKMQEHFKCCGNSVYEDWRYSSYYLKELKYPKSCCFESKRTDANCGKNVNNIEKKVKQCSQCMLVFFQKIL